MTKHISMQAIREADDLPTEEVPVDEWEEGAVILMRGLSAKKASIFSKKLVTTDEKGNVVQLNMENFMADLVTQCAINPDGSLMFGPEDADWLGEKSAVVLKRLSDAAQRLSGMGENAKKNAAKNSERIPGVETPTA